MGSKALSFKSYYGTKRFWVSKVFEYSYDQVKYQVYAKIESEFGERGENVQEVVDYLENIYLPGIKQIQSLSEHVKLFEEELALMKTSKEEATKFLFSEDGFLGYRIIQDGKTFALCELTSFSHRSDYPSNVEDHYWGIFKSYKRKHAVLNFAFDWLHCSRRYIDPGYQFDPRMATFADDLANAIADEMNRRININQEERQ